MADEDTQAAIEINEDAEDELQNTIEKPYGKLELVSFGPKTLLAGFSFYQRSYKGVQEAIEHLNSLGKNGAEVVTALLNSALSAASRTKATASAPMKEGKTPVETKELTRIARAEALAKGENVLILEEDAEKYIPGTRERYALGFFQRQLQAARKAFAENKTPANLAAWKKANAELHEAMQREAEETMAQALEAGLPVEVPITA